MKRGSLAWTGILLGLGAGIATGAALARKPFSFDRKVVVITGGSRGLGLLLARQLAMKGARLVLLARREEELQRAATDLKNRGAEVFTVSCDITDQTQVNDAFTRIASHFGRIDVLINNAGIIQVGPLEHMTVADFERAMNLHFYGPLYTTLAALPYLRRAGEARIVNVASIGGKIAVPHMAPYTASKFALVGFSDACRAELRKDNILVTTVCPAPLRTGSPLNAQFKGNFRREYAWFSTTDSLPFLSVDADRAARKIVSACRRGSPRLLLGVQTKAAILASELFPGASARLMASANRLLPQARAEFGFESHTGRESESVLTRSWLTRLTHTAAARNNELPGG